MKRRFRLILLIMGVVLLCTAGYLFYITYIQDNTPKIDRPVNVAEVTSVQPATEPTPSQKREQIPVNESTTVTRPIPTKSIIEQTPEPTLELTPEPTLEPTPELTPEPTSEPPPVKVVNHKFNELLERNSDVVGWIYIEGTKIDYPVMYDGTHHYLDYDIDGKKTTAASIYMDPSNDPDRDNYNILIHGHHMRNGTMFKDVVKYKEQKFFFSHRIINFDTLYDDMVWEVFSVYVINADYEMMYTDFLTDSDFVEMTENFHKRSMFSTNDVELTASDRLLTLSTCSYETSNSRTIVHARLIYKNGEKVAEPTVDYTPEIILDPVPETVATPTSETVSEPIPGMFMTLVPETDLGSE